MVLLALLSAASPVVAELKPGGVLAYHFTYSRNFEPIGNLTMAGKDMFNVDSLLDSILNLTQSSNGMVNWPTAAQIKEVRYVDEGGMVLQTVNANSWSLDGSLQIHEASRVRLNKIPGINAVQLYAATQVSAMTLTWAFEGPQGKPVSIFVNTFTQVGSTIQVWGLQVSITGIETKTAAGGAYSALVGVASEVATQAGQWSNRWKFWWDARTRILLGYTMKGDRMGAQDKQALSYELAEGSGAIPEYPQPMLPLILSLTIVMSLSLWTSAQKHKGVRKMGNPFHSVIAS